MSNSFNLDLGTRIACAPQKSSAVELENKQVQE